MPFCTSCSVTVDKKRWIGHLRSNIHKNNSSTTYCEGVQIVRSAFRGRIATYRLVAPEEGNELYCLISFFNSMRSRVKSLLDDSLKIHTSIKVNFELYAIFLLFKDDRQEIKSFATKNFPIHLNYNFNELYSTVENHLRKNLEEFQERDSGWSFLHNSHFEININKFQPLSGSTFVDLPKFIKNKRACLNIRNKDKHCFLWCVTAALYPANKHPERVSSYPHYKHVLNTHDISLPVSFSDISVFEKNNTSINIYVYGLKDNKIITGPLYKSENRHKNGKRIHLLLIDNNGLSHYCLIKNLGRLVRSQITKHHGSLFFCDSCLLFFPSEDELNNHVCGGVVTVLPNKGSVLQFKNFDRKQNVSFVIYADFETMLQPVSGCEPDPNLASTTDLQRHVPVAFAYNVVCSFDATQNKFVTYRGEDCVKKFIKLIHKQARNIHKVLSSTEPMIFTDLDSESFDKATICHICDHVLWFDKVRDHCHITGRYRGAAHQICNLRYKTPQFLPVFFHNLSGYDCHLFIKELGEMPGTVKVIPKNKENYISFIKFLPVVNDEFIQLRFTDSFKFMGTSLDKLAKTMKKDDFHCLRSHFSNDSQFHLLTRKGVYPYDYMNNWSCYSENALPPKSSFFNSLINEHISESDYKHAQAVWSNFKLKDLGEYTDLYLKTDVLLLTDIFEKFRKTCKRHYQLDPAFYVTAPSLSFDAMLLKTGIQLELLDDLSMIRMIQKGIRGGVCMCSHRYAKANNKYMPDYDSSKEDSFLVYLDCNNLYGYSMSQSLPYSNFRFLNHREVNELNILEVDDDAEYGYILEVDLFYPESLHRIHNDLPFCPEKCIPPGGRNSKLIPNLFNKYNYVIHYVHLKKCLEHGLLLRKIHRAITFRQSAYLKKYIELNTRLRQKAESVFEQDFFKLLNNSVFGKTLENNEARVNVQLVNTWSDTSNKTKKRLSASKLIANPYFHSVSVFTDNLVAVQMKPQQIILDKPIYIGFTVLELSKSHMYHFHYNIVKPFYDQRVQLCYTDTDSFIYVINTLDFYEDLKNVFLKFFDTSNFNNNNQFDLPLINKKVPGLFKDEMSGQLISDFVGLRSKLYCVRTLERVIKKAKGVKSYVIRDLNMLDYESVLLNKNVIRKKNKLFRSIRHEIFTRDVNKIVLSGNDDKRFISSDKISTIAWGSVDIL